MDRIWSFFCYRSGSHIHYSSVCGCQNPCPPEAPNPDEYLDILNFNNFSPDIHYQNQLIKLDVKAKEDLMEKENNPKEDPIEDQNDNQLIKTYLLP